MKMRALGYACLVGAVALVGFALWEMQSAAPQAPRSPAPSTISSAIATSSEDFSPVIRVIDGDTFVALVNGATTTVRVLGLDTPETVDPKKPIECFGPEASAEAKKILTGQSVRLVQDPSQDSHDIYGRELAYVYLPDGTLYDEFMIAQGYGHEYTFETPYEFQAQFKVAQAQAQKAQLGLWSPSTCNGNTGVGSGTTTIAS